MHATPGRHVEAPATSFLPPRRADAVAVIEAVPRLGPPLSDGPAADDGRKLPQRAPVGDRRYLEKHPARRWVALDDEELVRGEECAERRALFVDRVSTIDSTVGLQDVHVEEAIRVLCEQ